MVGRVDTTRRVEARHRAPPAAEDPAEWIALARQRALFGGPHPLVLAIARLPAADQDLIDRFLIVMAVRGETRDARLVESLAQEAFPACDGKPALFIPRMLRLLLKAARTTLAHDGRRGPR